MAPSTIGELLAQRQKAQRLADGGVPACGKIVAVRGTGVTVDDNPELEIDLAVTLPGGPPYEVTHRQVVARMASMGLRPGAGVPVRVDPDDRASILIVP